AALPRPRPRRLGARRARRRGRRGRALALRPRAPRPPRERARRDLALRRADPPRDDPRPPRRRAHPDAPLRALVLLGALAGALRALRGRLRRPDGRGVRDDRGEPPDRLEPAPARRAQGRLGRRAQPGRRDPDRRRRGRGRGQGPRAHARLRRQPGGERAVVLRRRLVPDGRPRPLRRRRLPRARGTDQGADHPRRREHLAVRDRGRARRPPERGRRRGVRDPRPALRGGGRRGGRARRRRRRGGAARLVRRAARALQGAEADLPARRDPAHADREAPAREDRRAADRRRPVKVVVLGAGAIGAYVGAALARGGTEVTLVARGEHLRALRERGVRVLSPRGDFEAHPPATDDWEAVADADAVFLGLKAYSLPEAAPRLGALLRPGTALVAAQNGIPWWYFESHGGPLDGLVLESVDPGGVIARSLPRGCAVGCVVYCSTELVEPGVVRHLEGTRFSLGEPDRSESERCRALSEAFRAGGLKAPVERDLRNEIWLKLLGNA